MRLALLVLVCFLAPALASSHDLTRRAAKKSQGNYKIVCYYGNWAVYRRGLARFTPQNINPYLCTHVIYAFGGFSNNFELKPFDKYNDIDQGNYKKFVELKKYNPRLKTLLAVGGWNEGSSRFSALVASPEYRERFVSSAIRFLRANGFDGLDLDWEYPTFRDGSDLADREGYATLIKELREAIDNEKLKSNKQRLLLTIAVPAGQDYIDQGFDIRSIVQNVDFMNLLTYDYHTAYEPAANHQAPLYKRPDLDEDDYRENLNIDSSVKYYLELGAPPEKLILGIPTYGRGYTLEDEDSNELGAAAAGPAEAGPFTKESGYMAYYEICQKIKDEGWEVFKPYPKEVGPYAVKGDQWIGFDDEDMVKRKAKYIRDKGLGGAMFWSLDNDDFRAQCGNQPNPLITTVRKVLLGKGSKESSNSIFWKSEKGNPPAVAASTNSDTTATKLPRHKTETSRRSTPTSTRRPFKITPRPLRSRTTTPEEIEEDDIDEDDDLLDTPPPPPTPDPGPAFECTDSGFFQNPTDCKKYFWCLDSGPANLGIVPHAFTCPSGLYFNKRTDACDYPERVKCKISPVRIQQPTTTTKASTPRRRTKVSKTTTTTTTTTTTPPPTTTLPSSKGNDLAELLRLIQQLGGVDGVQKYLEKKEGKDMTSLASQLKGSKHRTTISLDDEVKVTTKRTRLLATHTPRPRGKLFDDDDEDQPRAQSRAFSTDRSAKDATDRLTRNYVTITRTTTTEVAQRDNDEDDIQDEKTNPPTVKTTTEPPSTVSTRSLFKSTAIRLRTLTPRVSSTTPLVVRTHISPLRTRRLSTTTEIIPSTLSVPTTTTTAKTTTEEAPTDALETTVRTRRTTTRKPKIVLNLEDDEEEKVTTVAPVSLGSSEETKAEEKRGKWKPTRRVTRKRRPVAAKKTEEPPDIETTDSRLSTTVQKAPPGKKPLISKSKAEITENEEGGEKEDDDDEDFDTDGNEPIGDSASSGATNTFVFTTPRAGIVASTTEDLDSIPGEGKTLPAENKPPKIPGPVFNTQFTAGLGRPNNFRPLFSTQSLIPIQDDSNITETSTRIFIPPSRPSSPIRPLSSIFRPVSTTTTTTLKPPNDDEEEDDEEEEEEEEQTPAKPKKVTPRPIQTKPTKSESKIKSSARRPTPFPKVVPITSRPQPTLGPTEDITRAFNPDDDSEIGVDERGRLECGREGIFEHPISCSKFVNCVNTMGALRAWTYTCPPGLLYDVVVGHCNWQEQVDCGKRK